MSLEDMLRLFLWFFYSLAFRMASMAFSLAAIWNSWKNKEKGEKGNKNVKNMAQKWEGFDRFKDSSTDSSTNFAVLDPLFLFKQASLSI